MYADDTHLTDASNNNKEIKRTLDQHLANVSDWLMANKLTLNKSKTKFIVIGSWERLNTFDNLPNLVLDSFPVKQVSTTKSVGVLLDEHLSWNAHMLVYSASKIASGIDTFKRCRYFVPIETLKYAYNAIVQPHFDFL